jgi:hypothetical protein
MRGAIALALTMALSGCALGGGGTPQPVALHSDATVTVDVRLGTFRPGEASVSDNQLVGQTVLNPKGSAEIDLPPGKYTLDAVATNSPDKETAVTTIEVKAGQPMTVTLVEHFELYRKNLDPGEPTVNKRILGWDN